MLPLSARTRQARRLREVAFHEEIIRVSRSFGARAGGGLRRHRHQQGHRGERHRGERRRRDRCRTRAAEQHGDGHDRRRRRRLRRDGRAARGERERQARPGPGDRQLPVDGRQAADPRAHRSGSDRRPREPPMSRPPGHAGAARHAAPADGRVPRGDGAAVHPGHRHAHRAAQLQPRQLRRRRVPGHDEHRVREHGHEHLLQRPRPPRHAHRSVRPGRRADVPERGLPGLGSAAEAEPPRRGAARGHQQPGARPVGLRSRGRRRSGRLRVRVAERELVPLPRRPLALPEHRPQRAERADDRHRQRAPPATVGLPPVGLDARDRRRHRRDRHLPEGDQLLPALRAGARERDAVPPAHRAIRVHHQGSDRLLLRVLRREPAGGLPDRPGVHQHPDVQRHEREPRAPRVRALGRPDEPQGALRHRVLLPAEPLREGPHPPDRGRFHGQHRAEPDLLDQPERPGRRRARPHRGRLRHHHRRPLAAHRPAGRERDPRPDQRREHPRPDAGRRVQDLRGADEARHARQLLLGRHRGRPGELRAARLALHAGVDRPADRDRPHHRRRHLAAGIGAPTRSTGASGP